MIQSYIKEPLKQYNPTRTLRSSNGLLLTVAKSIHNTTGDRSLSYSVKNYRRIAELSSFKSVIKGLLFNEAYSHLS